MTKHTNQVSQAEVKLTEKMVLRCVRLLRKKEYELNLPKDAPYRALDMLSVRKTARGGSSSAGAHSIEINLGYWQIGNKLWTEYKSFNEDPTIGKITVNSKEDAMWVQVAHEVSHHVQYRYCRWVPRFKTNYHKPHGDCFRWVYRYLRRDLINPMIKEGA